MLNKTGAKPLYINSLKVLWGVISAMKKYTSHNEVSTWYNHNNN